MEERKLRCQRNRNRSRSRGRGLRCPIDHCLLESNGRKYHLHAERVEQLRAHGVSKRQAVLALLNSSTVTLTHSWLEEFWCRECQCRRWFFVSQTGERYDLALATAEHWQQSGVQYVPERGNPSVSEFTLTHARGTRLREGRR